MSCRGSHAHSRGLPTLLLCWVRRWSTVCGGQYNIGFGSCVRQIHVCISPLENHVLCWCWDNAGALPNGFHCRQYWSTRNAAGDWVAALNVLRVLSRVFVLRMSSRAHTCMHSRGLLMLPLW
jgi:hypothetical protein